MGIARMLTLALFGVLLWPAVPAGATEEAEYRVLRQDNAIEIREYVPSIVAEVIIEGDFRSAGNRAFRPLFRYIDGHNTARREIAMTAPVTQQKRGTKIAMTAPVSQAKVADGWAVSFMMPASLDMETVPEPRDPAVAIRQLPAHRAVAIRYTGGWSEQRYLEHLQRLQGWVAHAGLETVGEPVWARYNAPYVPWWLRRNEILLRLAPDSIVESAMTPP